MFYIFVSDSETGMEDICIKAADDTKRDQVINSRAGLPCRGTGAGEESG